MPESQAFGGLPSSDAPVFPKAQARHRLYDSAQAPLCQ